ncbi:hypothetical protein BOX15_Mlig003752g1, partial [Macrostomum lignano]
CAPQLSGAKLPEEMASQQPPVKKVPLKRLSQIGNGAESQRTADGQKQADDQQDEDAVEMVSVTSRGSDRRLSMKQKTSNSCTDAFTLDDWLAVLLAVALVCLAVFAGLCGVLHGERKHELTSNRPFNMALLVSGCVAMTLQLLCACVFASQWLTGV